MSRILNLRTLFKKTSAVLLCGMVLFLTALAASPSLHQWFHHDADDPDHECAVTLFVHGQVSAAARAPVAAALVALFWRDFSARANLRFSFREIIVFPPAAPPRLSFPSFNSLSGAEACAYASSLSAQDPCLMNTDNFTNNFAHFHENFKPPASEAICTR